MGKGLGKDRRKLQWLPPFRPRVVSQRAGAKRRLLGCPIGYRNFRHRLAWELTGITSATLLRLLLLLSFSPHPRHGTAPPYKASGAATAAAPGIA